MKSSKVSKENMMEQGRVIARAMSDLKVEQKKNMIKAVERREILLHTAAEQALSGN
jgi:hypothetical protein